MSEAGSVAGSCTIRWDSLRHQRTLERQRIIPVYWWEADASGLWFCSGIYCSWCVRLTLINVWPLAYYKKLFSIFFLLFC